MFLKAKLTDAQSRALHDVVAGVTFQRCLPPDHGHFNAGYLNAAPLTYSAGHAWKTSNDHHPVPSPRSERGMEIVRRNGEACMW